MIRENDGTAPRTGVRPGPRKGVCVGESSSLSPVAGVQRPPNSLQLCREEHRVYRVPRARWGCPCARGPVLQIPA